MSADGVESGLFGDPGFPEAQRLKDKVAIITGAGSRPSGKEEPIVGNGKAMAIMFAREGARVAILDTQLDWAQETHSVIQREGGDSMLLEADVSNEASCRGAVEQVLEAFRRLDVLVNNVGITGPAGTAVEVDPDAFDAAMRINLTSMVMMSKFAIPAMLESDGGSIINLSSVAGIEGGHPSLLYPTSKTAVIGLTRSMAAHHGREGIRVNAIAPGMVYTPMVASRGMTEDLRHARRDGSMLQTEGTAWDIARAAAFLASDAARWITGTTLVVDAGASSGKTQALSPRSDSKPLPGFGG